MKFKTKLNKIFVKTFNSLIITMIAVNKQQIKIKKKLLLKK